MNKRKAALCKKIKNVFINMGIKNRAFLYVGLLLVLSIMLAVGVFSVVFRQTALEDNAEYSRKRLENLSTHLESYFDEISAIANETNYNYYLQNYLANISEEDENIVNLQKGGSVRNYEMSTKIFNYALNNRTDVSSIMVFGKKKMLLYKSLYSYQNYVKDYSEYEWYQKAVENPRQSIITGPQVHEFLMGNTEQTISLSRMINSSENGSFAGVIVIDMNLNQIEEICDSSDMIEHGSLCILNGNGELVYKTESADENYDLSKEETLKELRQTINTEEDVEKFVALGDGEYQIGREKMNAAGWTLISIIPKQSIMQSIHTTVLYLALTGILLNIVIVLALNSILNKVVQPISLLKKSMDEAEAENLKVRVSVAGRDEIGMLAKSYNKMMERIEYLMNQVVREQEEKRKFELQALQAQINPHFLYNTLDSIIWMAETKNDKVVPMTEALAKLFRLSLNKGNEFITLGQEMEHVQNYLLIQSMRYTDKFDYEIMIAEELRSCRTIKLLVQPIVENCIYHGIKKQKGKGKIQVFTYKEDGNIYIEVIDDGIGMTEEMCIHVLDRNTKAEKRMGSGMGVWNVNERIKLYFGEIYGLTFESKAGKGTKVTICLPVLPKTETERS